MNTARNDEHPVAPETVRHDPAPPRNPWLGNMGFWLMLAIAAFYLVTEHRAHLIAGLIWLPWLLLLACPLMHIFGHGGHGSHGGQMSHSDHKKTAANSTEQDPQNSVPSVDAKADRSRPSEGDLP